jgi:hypothetical protein
LIRLQVDRLPSGGDPLPLWLWSSATGLSGEDVDVRWQAFLRRFDIEHLFRLMKQTLGWTRPKLRTPEASERWTWLIIAAHTQLRLTREAAADLRRPWEKRAEPARLTPARVRRGFRNLRPHLHCPARGPKPSTPGPGRATWLEEPAARHPLRRGQDCETTRKHHRTKPTQTIKNKLGNVARGAHHKNASSDPVSRLRAAPVARHRPGQQHGLGACAPSGLFPGGVATT